MSGGDGLVVVILVGLIVATVAFDVVTRRRALQRQAERNAEARRLRREIRRLP